MDACIEYSKEGDHDKSLLIGYMIALLQNVYKEDFEKKVCHHSKRKFYGNKLSKDYIGFKYVGIKDDYDYYVEQYGLPFDLYLGYETEYYEYLKNEKTNTERYDEISRLCNQIENYLESGIEKYENCEEFKRDIIIKLCKNPYKWGTDTKKFIRENRLLLGDNYVITNHNNKIIHDKELESKERRGELGKRELEFGELLNNWEHTRILDPEPYVPPEDHGIRQRRKSSLKRKYKVKKSRSNRKSSRKRKGSKMRSRRKSTRKCSKKSRRR